MRPVATPREVACTKLFKTRENYSKKLSRWFDLCWSERYRKELEELVIEKDFAYKEFMRYPNPSVYFSVHGEYCECEEYLKYKNE